MEDSLAQVAARLRRAERILFITGAGMSADSGLPTYRGIGGLYDGAVTEEGVRIEEAISGPMFAARPEVTWKYLRQIEESCRGARFNRGHEVIAEIEQAKPRSWVLTQNIDGFHRAAGSRNIIEIHGRFSDLHCVACDYRRTVEDYSTLPPLPECPHCGALVRPGVVLFGEVLPQAAVMALYRELGAGFDMIFSIGTTSQFPYIAQPVLMAQEWGALSVEINPAHTPVSDYVDYRFAAGAAATLDALWRKV